MRNHDRTVKTAERTVFGGLAQTSPFEVCDAPQGHPKVRRSAPSSLPDRSLREIADSTERSLRQPAKVRRFPKAVSAAEAVRILSTILALPGLQILPMPAQVVAGWVHLLGRRAVEGAGVFDLQIIATMLANGVQRIYTFNPADFQVFAELTVVAPA
jgi:predicted nucleic acid-binding protein